MKPGRLPPPRNSITNAPFNAHSLGYAVRTIFNVGNKTVKPQLLSRNLGHRSVYQIVPVRLMSTVQRTDTTSAILYVCSVGVVMLGLAYAGVPLYRMFCQATGQGGQATVGHDTSKVTTMSPVADREIRIKFNADIGSSMQWNFRPQQSEVVVAPGETALAFYRAKNPSDKPVIGISTYNVLPFEAGLYFNKIQCFCFEEQRLNPHEEVDMPVFFYIDPDYVLDPKLENVDEITLSYTFFEAKEGFQIPLPGYMRQKEGQ